MDVIPSPIKSEVYHDPNNNPAINKDIPYVHFINESQTSSSYLDWKESLSNYYLIKQHQDDTYELDMITENIVDEEYIREALRALKDVILDINFDPEIITMLRIPHNAYRNRPNRELIFRIFKLLPQMRRYSVKLRKEDGVDSDDITLLSSALSKMTKLHELHIELDGMTIGLYDMYELYKPLPNMTALKKLVLRYIECSGLEGSHPYSTLSPLAVSMSDYLAKLDSLEELDVVIQKSEHSFIMNLVTEIAEGMKAKSLRRAELNFSEYQLNEEDMALLSVNVSRSCTLEYLSLTCQIFQSKSGCLQTFTNNLAKAAALKELHLNMNLSVEFLTALCQSGFHKLDLLVLNRVLVFTEKYKELSLAFLKIPSFTRKLHLSLVVEATQKKCEVENVCTSLEKLSSCLTHLNLHIDNKFTQEAAVSLNKVLPFLELLSDLYLTLSYKSIGHHVAENLINTFLKMKSLQTFYLDISETKINNLEEFKTNMLMDVELRNFMIITHSGTIKGLRSLDNELPYLKLEKQNSHIKAKVKKHGGCNIF